MIGIIECKVIVTIRFEMEMEMTGGEREREKGKRADHVFALSERAQKSRVTSRVSVFNSYIH